MSKRAIYAIPLAGLALTSFGCGEDVPPVVEDNIVDTFSTDTAFLAANPYTATGADVNGDASNYCDVTYLLGNLTIGADYTGTLPGSSTLSNCVPDATANGTVVNYEFVVAATVVTANTTYAITLTNEAGNVLDLDCTLAGVTLSCDVGADAAVFVFTAQ
jgi:hypothetical protein